ncbi:hypothetical protein Ctob_007122 [Chrysochromulina tobinii]|uniref:Uncharacterized protein n=1 Tax=Chrysochromulina tobinii TaxID=1460289 RepID=A0A0M0JKC9_9EUKA|nr:hypothetical protein Ctob_007122 [Chrysochromulina tobinii]|eukprot:KOO26797.1 hypothetical protein Ctob_007122 [Chrysochromulina sp. CCMP291]
MVLDGSERISRSGDEERMQVLNTARSERISRSGDEGRMQVLNTARSERISRSGDEGEAEDEAEDEADGQIPEIASPGGLSSTIETLIDGLRLGPARTAAATEAARAWFMEQGYADSMCGTL